MTVAASPSARPPGRRAWLVLVLLVGLLAMHGLASDHPGMASAVGQPASAQGSAADPDAGLLIGTRPPTGTAEMAGMATSGGAVDRRLTPPAVGRSLAAGPMSRGPHGMGAVGLCLAVLTAVLALAAVARRLLPRSAPRRDLRWLSALLARARVLPPAQPPDLVAGLCVSRT